MKKSVAIIIIILGIYEIFYSVRVFWNLINSKLESIFIADIILKGQSAGIIFASFGLAALLVGFGLIFYKKWALWGMIALNTVLLLLYISNLLFINGDDFLRAYQSVSDDMLLRYRIMISWKSFIAIVLLAITLLCRKAYVDAGKMELKPVG